MKRLAYVPMVLILGLGLGAVTAAAESNVAAPFLQKGTGGRALGMGTCFTAVAEGPFGFIYNPAGLADAQSPQIGFQHEGTAYDLQHESLAGRFAWGPGYMGALLNYFNYGQVERWDEFGQPLGEELKLYDFLLSVGYGLALDPAWRVGANLGTFTLNLGTESLSGLTADLGVGWLMNSAWTLGAVIKNIGTPVEGYSLPTSLRIATAWRVWEQRMLLDIELEAPLAQDTFNFGIGAEYRIWDWLDARLGFKVPLSQKHVAEETLRLGLGFNFTNFGLDITLGGRGDFGSEVIFALVYDFNGPRAAALTLPTKPAIVPEEAPAPLEVPRIGPDIQSQAQFHYQAGQEYERYGQIIDAIVEYKAALRLRPDYPEAQLALNAAREKAKKNEAEGKNNLAATSDSLQKTIRKYYEKGVAAYQHRDYSEAIKQLQLVLELTSQHQEATELLKKAKVALHQELSNLEKQAAQASQNGDLAGEVDAYQKMLDLDPENPQVLEKWTSTKNRIPKEVERLYKVGLDYYAQGQLRQALKAFETLLRLQPDHVKAKDAVKNIKEKLVQTGQ